MIDYERLFKSLERIEGYLQKIQHGTWGYDGECGRCGFKGKAGTHHICPDLAREMYERTLND